MVVKCPNCNQYVSDTASVCPKCGASMTVSTAKNFAGSATDANNYNESQKAVTSQVKAFPELIPYLRQHLIKHEEVGNSSSIDTSIGIKDEDGIQDDFIHIYNHWGQWLDGEPVRLGGENSGLCLRLGFLADWGYKDDVSKQLVNDDNERFLRFRNLTCFSLFTPHRSNYTPETDPIWREQREFALDLGKDLEQASLLISEILQKVYLVPLSQELEIFVENRDDDQEIESDQTVNESTDDGIYEVEDDSAGLWMNVLCFLIPIVGLVLYFVKKDNYPNTAKSYITWAAAGFVVTLLIKVIS